VLSRVDEEDGRTIATIRVPDKHEASFHREFPRARLLPTSQKAASTERPQAWDPMDRD
jgi:GTP-binding protein HflX